MKSSFVYITTSDKQEARSIGKTLVESRLAACANIIDNMNSLYWWEDEVQEATETVLILKTRQTLIPTLIEKVQSIHSYECPCVIALPILAGNPDYLEWIRNETAARSLDDEK